MSEGTDSTYSMSTHTAPTNGSILPFPPMELSLSTTTRRMYPSTGPEYWEPVRVTAKILTEANCSDEQGLTYMAGDILNMLSWVPGYLDSAQISLKPSDGFLKIRYQQELDLSLWEDMHTNDEDFGQWLQTQMEPIWLAFCVRNNYPEEIFGEKFDYLVDVLLDVLRGVPYSDALSMRPKI